MLVNSVLWNVWNPGRYLPRNYCVHLARDGRTEVGGEDEVDKRPLLAKVGAVLTFGVLFGEKKDERSFHDLNDYNLANRQVSLTDLPD